MADTPHTPPSAGHDPTQSMIARLIEWSIHHQLIVVILTLGLAVAGVLAVQRTPLDAIPDLSDTQVIIRTEFPGQAPQIVEDLVTYPLSTTLLGLPKTQAVRGFSMFGTSFVYVIFQDGVDMYWARSRVAEALATVQKDLPDKATPRMGPDATGVGWIFQYALVDPTGQHDLAELRALQDWFLKFELATVPGVSEVASVGGFVREYQVRIDPNRLRAFDVPLSRVQQAVKAASLEVGGRVLERAETELMIRSKGYVTSLHDLQQVVVYAKNGRPVLLTDVARVVEGPELRRGVVELNGEGEVVGGIVVMRSGENALTVIEAVQAKLAQLRPGLPAGVEIRTVYDRAPLIRDAVDYLKHKLLEEGLVVALVCLVFLLHVRSALVAIITLPLGILGAFILMSSQGITANIMSLGGIAIAIGAMVDASIVMVENAHRKLSDLPQPRSAAARRQALIVAAQEVGPGLFFSLLIITVSFLPVFALTGESHRLFAPLAYTKTYAMAFASILSVTIVPILMVWLIRGRIFKELSNPLNRLFVGLYRPILRLALHLRWFTLLLAVVGLMSLQIPLKNLGSEFMPALYEGELLYMPTTLPGVSIGKAKEILAQTNRLIMTVPEVERVFGKLGRADTATDPAPISMIESWIKLKPKAQWRTGLDVEGLIKELDQRVKLPGLVNSWGYPIKIRMDMISTGIRTPVGIKISGQDLQEIGRIALDVEAAVKDVRGTRSAFADRVSGGRYLEIDPNREELARRNIDLALFQSIIQTALGGMKIAESIQGRERYNIQMRYDRPFRESEQDLAEILVPTPMGQHIPLGELATITYAEGPPMIKSEDARLTGWVFVDMSGRDMGGYVTEAQAHIAKVVPLPPGYAITWSGQYEQMMEARQRLNIAIPAAAAIILLLLMIHFGRLDRTMMVMTALPFGLVGGLWAVYLADYHLSVAVAVGFIALGGIAVETAVVMLLYIDQQVRHDQPQNHRALFDAVITGAAMRVRPKLMTVAVIIAGLLPIFYTDGSGSDVMRRIALPMVGGMLSTTLMTLIVIPVLYMLWEARRLPIEPNPTLHSGE
ncbi:heavy metal efflux pump, CzcA family [Magnetococcus marinus MC-1]|uniref:Heavy metal efflux pump, CzcA family n=1 Tax=Magnetococcus marinus (strain ATCC BAA-1437 / JCM 17883 / MC-1) TaxID=156889 RepID=A0LD28_MAGMM|nr:CusA/CzcA family heavy metal efflux RND transporter [Magnetococcus marinus]ABK45871.1 heavy metal efflux pump, CzcA family [Magnetococcus marinus MC-1]